MFYVLNIFLSFFLSTSIDKEPKDNIKRKSYLLRFPFYNFVKLNSVLLCQPSSSAFCQKRADVSVAEAQR